MITQLPPIFLPGQIKLTPGRASDYHALARFHYAPSPPATFAEVICAHWRAEPLHREADATRCMLSNQNPLPRRGASRGSDSAEALRSEIPLVPRTHESAARAAASPQPLCITNDFPARLIGVIVLSYPSALHRTRHRVFGLRSMRFGDRLRWINANLRTISRVIVHPQFRGVGLSTMLIRAAVGLCRTPFVEASARMGRAHPLFDHAGFERVAPMTDDEAIYFWRRGDTGASDSPWQARFSEPVPPRSPANSS